MYAVCMHVCAYVFAYLLHEHTYTRTHTHTGRSAMDAVEKSKKWIRWPKQDELDRFLSLTNGQEGMWETREEEKDDMSKDTNAESGTFKAKKASAPPGQVRKAYSFVSDMESPHEGADSHRPRHSNKVTPVPNRDTSASEEAVPWWGPSARFEAKVVPWCGTFQAEGQDEDLHFMTVDVSDYNPHLIRFYMEHVWKLKRPEVIISVTGGAADFDLSTEQLDRIFKEMMDGTRSLDAWFVTPRS